MQHTEIKTRTDNSSRNFVVMDYDTKWVKTFLKEKEVLEKIYTNALSIEHIGSTSVIGMAGKPLIDILIIVENLLEVSKNIDQMIDSNFVHYGNLLNKDGELFVKEVNGEKLVNVHIYHKDNPHVEEMLLVRNYLQNHTEEVKNYSNLKKELKQKYSDNYPMYRKLKNEYMEKLKERAGKWIF